ncbi:MAG: stage II sporulation protein M [Christensenellales bacterium]
MKRTPRQKSMLKNMILGYINENIKIYAIVTLMFLIGWVIGIIFVNNSQEVQQEQINGYINTFIQGIKSDAEISKPEILKNSILSNLGITVLLWFLGSTVIGMPLIYIVILYKGYSIGCTISAIVASLGTGKGIVFILSTMLLQSIIYIPCLLSLAVSGVKLYKQIMEDRRTENIKIQILRHSIFCVFIFLMLVIAALIETYISTNIAQRLIKFC